MEIKPETIEEAIDEIELFFICDLYSKFRPETKIKGEKWVRDDYFKNEKEFEKYLNTHFNLLREQIKSIVLKKQNENPKKGWGLSYGY